uniref:plasmid partition family protein n=1 Tax=Borreliella tanukii TaxID=56146 RepID=UPI003B21EDAE
MAKLLFEGELKEIDIIENGIDKTLVDLIKGKNLSLHRFNKTDLAWVFKTQEKCDFYKRNPKFTNIFLKIFIKKIKSNLLKN